MTNERGWRMLYVVGGVAAFMALALMVLDIVLTMLPGWGTGTTPTTAMGWFEQFAVNPLLGMRNLDFLNITASVIVLPLYVAIYGALRHSEPALALTGLIVVALGTAVFVSANAALPMLELSRQYATASEAADKAALLSAAQALLASGAHGGLGAFPGFVLSEIGTLLTGVALLRSGAFGRRVAWVGIVGVTVLLGYTTAYTFISATNDLVMLAAIPGGLLMIAWYVIVGRRLLGLSASPAEHAPRAAAIPAPVRS